MNDRIAITTCLVLFGAFGTSPAWGQFGRLRELAKKVPGVPRVNGAALQQAGDMALYLTIATDQGMKALDELAAAFPDEKVAAYKLMSAKYNEAKATRKEGNIDAESFILATQAAEEMAKLESDWESYRKDGTKNVRKAHARLGLMLIADAQASRKAPQTIRSLETEMRVLAADPTHVERATQMRSSATFLRCVGEQAPSQTRSFTTVRRIAKRIAEAEKYQLAPDPPAESLTTASQMKVAATKIDADIPSED